MLYEIILHKIMLTALVLDKTRCCGCSACENICPKDCIQMKPDGEGFLYPMVESDKCIQCKMCDTVCPMKHPPIRHTEIRQAYAVRSKSKEVVKNSASGGFFTPLARAVLSADGIICAATFDDDFRVIHDILQASDVHKQEDPFKHYRGSKYVQSDLLDSFTKIKKFLIDGKTVCFIGTTCQVAGLKNFVCGYDERLLTVDLVCKGTPSPKLWKAYRDYQMQKYGSTIIDASFRNKTYGYHNTTMKLKFQDGQEYYGSGRIDFMLKSFFSEIASRPSCYTCPFKQGERCSDITIYDCWHISNLVSGVKDDNQGYTNVMIHSVAGRQILENIMNEVIIYPVDNKKAVGLDGIMVEHAAKPHPKRSEFYKELDSNELPTLIQKFIPIHKTDYIIEKCKGFLYKSGLLQTLKILLKP